MDPVQAPSAYQSLVVLPVDGDDAALHKAVLVGLLDADVNHLWEVTVRLQLLKKHTGQNRKRGTLLSKGLKTEGWQAGELRWRRDLCWTKDVLYRKTDTVCPENIGQ